MSERTKLWLTLLAIVLTVVVTYWLYMAQYGHVMFRIPL